MTDDLDLDAYEHWCTNRDACMPCGGKGRIAFAGSKYDCDDCDGTGREAFMRIDLDDLAKMVGRIRAAEAELRKSRFSHSHTMYVMDGMQVEIDAWKARAEKAEFDAEAGGRTLRAIHREMEPHTPNNVGIVDAIGRLIADRDECREAATIATREFTIACARADRYEDIAAAMEGVTAEACELTAEGAQLGVVHDALRRLAIALRAQDEPEREPSGTEGS